uniref:Uncharacterized protein n=1 Tax=Nelumbo nucifera TaxID=4432 RepID=A0A822XN05_NELNU|nr:TPA_asm: hypothetical protein HUJ06_022546 [Nelumbo nucifera]
MKNENDQNWNLIFLLKIHWLRVLVGHLVWVDIEDGNLPFGRFEACEVQSFDMV